MAVSQIRHDHQSHSNTAQFSHIKSYSKISSPRQHTGLLHVLTIFLHAFHYDFIQYCQLLICFILQNSWFRIHP